MLDDIRPPALLLDNGTILAGSRFREDGPDDTYELIRADGVHVLVPLEKVAAVFLRPTPNSFDESRAVGNT